MVRFGWVLARTTLPTRSTVRWLAVRSAASTSSVISFSLPETDSMSTSARVSATGSATTSGVRRDCGCIARGYR